jgi:hypothetical protein
MRSEFSTRKKTQIPETPGKAKESFRIWAQWKKDQTITPLAYHSGSSMVGRNGLSVKGKFNEGILKPGR